MEYGIWDGGNPQSSNARLPVEPSEPHSIERRLAHLENEELSLKGRVKALENAMEDLDMSVRMVTERVYGGEDMGLDAWGMDEIQRLRATILAHYDEQRELSYQRLRAIDRERDALYTQRNSAY